MKENWSKVQIKQTLENGVHTVVFTKLNGEVSSANKLKIEFLNEYHQPWSKK